MEDHRSVLSIVIPTYNRRRHLQQLLNTLIGLRKDYPFDICVSDNCSSDGTKELMEDYSSQHAITYQRNSENIGIDRNMQAALEMGKGQYVWALADDNDVYVEYFPRLWELLKDDYDVILLEGRSDFKRRPYRPRTYRRSQQSCCYDDPLRLFRDFWGGTTFGSLVYNRQLIEFGDFEKYYDTYHAYVAVMWDYLAHKFINQLGVSAYYEESPVLVYKSGVKKSWSSFSLQVFYKGIPLFFRELPAFYHPVSKRFEKYYIDKKTDMMTMIIYTEKYQLDEEDIGSLSVYLDKSHQGKMLEVFNMPGWKRKLTYYFYRLTRKRPSAGFDARFRVSVDLEPRDLH